MRYSTTLLLLICLATALAAPPDNPAKVEQLLRKMTLDEKIGQLSQVGGLAIIPNAPKPEESIRKSQAGSILWVSDTATINRLQKIAMEETRLKVPLIFALDVIHGYRTIFPMPLAMAASWDPAMIEKVQAVAAREARASGIAWTFGPMVDIARDVRWGRMIEGAGEDPFLGAAVARAQVRGFQGDDVSRPDKMLACAKHFAGYGAPTGGRDYDSAFISDSEMWNVYLPPFRAAAEAGVASFMPAYMDLNDIPAGANHFLLQDVLRKSWKFNGIVVSDAFAVRDLVTHGFAKDASDAAFRALRAGMTMDMASGTYTGNLVALVKSGKIKEAEIDALVRPILDAKFRLGLFERPYVDEAKAKTIIADPAHRQAARDAARRSAVLLRNENGALPLKKDASKSIAVIGPLGNHKRNMLTMWSGFDLDYSRTVTVLEGIRNALGPQAKVEHAEGVQINKEFHSMFETMAGSPPVPKWSDERSKQEFDKAIDLAKRSDVVVLTLGEEALMSGEMASQASLDMPGKQQELMEAVAALGKPTVLVLINGRPLNLLWASQHLPAILEAWHPGTEGGNAIADLLFGDANPSGKLPVTWPRTVGQVPMYYAHNLTHAPEGANQFSTSRYWDIASSPLYPFGYGLSYAKFAVSNLQLKSNNVTLGATVEISVDVANSGSRAGDEVVQVYIHQRAGLASRPVRELKGFEKVSLAPGTKKTLRFTIGKNELTYWNSQARSWVLDAADFDLWVGADSTASLHAEFKVTQ